MRLRRSLIAALMLAATLDCGTDDGSRTRTAAGHDREDGSCLTPPTPSGSFTFAFIGDFGDGSDAAKEVAALVASEDPLFVVTGGDNGYGSASYDDVVDGSDLYGDFLDCQDEGSGPNYFWPSIGNHDVDDVGISKYLEFFELPRWYDVEIGPVHFFVIDSTSSLDDQEEWLEQKLEQSSACHKLVVFHHAPFSSGDHHGSDSDMQWDFAEWGATGVLAGHEHLYERLERGGIPYFVNGLGGKSRYEFDSDESVSGSKVRFRSDYGAMFVDVNGDELTYRFVDVDGDEVDRATYGCSGGGGGDDGDGDDGEDDRPVSSSCEGLCDQDAGSCWCDDDCVYYRDCCEDVADHCGPPTPSPQPLPRYQEPFDGIDGAPWPAQWRAIGTNESTATLSDRGTPQAPDSWGRLSSRSETNRMFHEGASTGPDVEVELSVVLIDPSEQGVSLYLRANGGVLQQTVPPGDGYAAYVKGGSEGSISLWRERDGLEQELASIRLEDTPVGTLEAGVPLRMRMQCVGADDSTRVRAKVWPQAAPEPRDWAVEHDDDDPERLTAPGGVAIDLYNRGDEGSETTLFVDDLRIVDLSDPPVTPPVDPSEPG